MSSTNAVWVTVDDFGSYKDETGITRQVKRFTWENVGKVTVQVRVHFVVKYCKFYNLW